MVTLNRGNPPVNLMFTRRTTRKMLGCGIAVTRVLEGTKFVDHWLCTKKIVFFGHPWDAAHQLTYHRTSLIIIARVMCNTQFAHLWVADRKKLWSRDSTSRHKCSFQQIQVYTYMRIHVINLDFQKIECSCPFIWVQAFSNHPRFATSKVMSPSHQEALQEILDHTFKRVLTRDRVPDDVRDPKMVINRFVANLIILCIYILYIYIY